MSYGESLVKPSLVQIRALQIGYNRPDDDQQRC